MSGQNLYAALLRLRATARPAPTPTTIVPQEGARWCGANPEPRQGRTRPTPPTTHQPKESYVSNNTLPPLTVHVPDLPPLAHRVAAGAALLDRVRPGWATRVDPDQLDMTAEYDDLLGQLYGCYAIGLETLIQASPDDEAWPSMWAVNHGFDLVAYDTADFAELTDCWRTLILARRRGGGEGR